MTAEYRCPECGNSTLHLEITQTATVRFNEDGEHEVIDAEGDMEWDEHTWARCRGCNYPGSLHEFLPANQTEETS